MSLPYSKSDSEHLLLFRVKAKALKGQAPYLVSSAPLTISPYSSILAVPSAWSTLPQTATQLTPSPPLGLCSNVTFPMKSTVGILFKIEYPLPFLPAFPILLACFTFSLFS